MDPRVAGIVAAPIGDGGNDDNDDDDDDEEPDFAALFGGPAPIVAAPIAAAPIVAAPIVPAPIVAAPIVAAPIVAAPVRPRRRLPNLHMYGKVGTRSAAQNAAMSRVMHSGKAKHKAVKLKQAQHEIACLSLLTP